MLQRNIHNPSSRRHLPAEVAPQRSNSIMVRWISSKSFIEFLPQMAWRPPRWLIFDEGRRIVGLA
ncbi:hypothetical protein QUC32_16750 [Novosphingobium resinovorum]|uniref:hypothetical protein n=1 Tax=Novosphingobium TaxID=165696 RepID=UPI0012DD51FA|nr:MULTISPECIES: hypothetical protein [Novosphingobium]MBF7011316.1 hypothetical protein [Novosphingobium sp. HR1a]WJM29298.1 hypothetical protein QUC32_16750 [Novosphingobium resinovorum]